MTTMVAKEQPTFADVPARVDSNQLELELLDFWQQEKIFEASLEQTKDKPRFTFYDGPPYATGKPHYGHVLQSAIKDTVLRYKTMQGFRVPRRVGWDCHGLPVETLVEKEMGSKGKKDIEALGIAAFNAKCREVVFRYIDDFTVTLKRMGRWAEYDNAYATLNKDYMESEWWVFKQLWDQELVYQAFRSTPYCIRCATPLSNFEVTSNYHDKVDKAVYILFKVRDQDNRYLAVWTTTPWTLPGNVAVEIGPEIEYVVAAHEDKEIVIAHDRVTAVLGEAASILQSIGRDELLAYTYEPLYQFLPAGNAFRVVEGEHVTSDDGTGLVHMAPAFGEEDAEVARANDLPVLRTVDTNGNFIAEVTPWAGQNIFAANEKVIADLVERGIVLKQEDFKHSYPFCWRCDQPLIYYALDTWFLKVQEFKQQLLATNEQIHWTPTHVKQGRFAKGIESAPDWAISRNRYWSVPIPIWECEGCKHRHVIGSIAELQELTSSAAIEDIHRPMVDDYTWKCSECQGVMRRVPEVLAL